METWRIQLYSNSLMHYGVQGMKWGVRRYQDYNGHLTAAGRKQLASDKKGFRSRMKIRGQGIKQDISDTVRSVKSAKGVRNKLSELVGHGRSETARLNTAWTQRRLANASKTKTGQYIHNVSSKNASGLARTSQMVKRSSAGRRFVNYIVPLDDFNTPYQRLSGRTSRYGLTYLAQMTNYGIMSGVLDVAYMLDHGDPRKKKIY